MGKFPGSRKNAIKSIIASIIAISLCLSGCTSSIDHVDATIILVYQNNIGAIFHNGTSVQMPEVNVHSIYTQDSGSVNISQVYEISTDTTQNMTLAIAYPTPSANYYNYSDPTVDITISLNSTQINYRTLSWIELGWNSSDYDEFNFNADWFFSTLYVVLNLPLLQNTISIIKVNVQDVARNIDQFHLNHFVGSTKTFDSDTNLRVEFDVIDNDNLLESSEFDPTNFRTIVSYNQTTQAIWDFHLNEIGFDTVSINLFFNIYHQPDSWPIYFLTTAVGQILIGATVIFVLVAIYFHYKRN